MKRIVFLLNLLCLLFVADSYGQTTNTDERQEKRIKKLQRKKSGKDSTKATPPKQRKLNPDSLRRGGVTRVDTVR